MRGAFEKSNTWSYVIFARLPVFAFLLHPATAADAQTAQVAFNFGVPGARTASATPRFSF